MTRRWLPVAVAVLAACERPVVTHDEALDFQDVKLGESRTLPLTLTNPTSSNLEVTTTFSGSDEGFFVQRGKLVVPANGSMRLDVMFEPTRLGPVEAEALVFVGTEVSRVKLHGRGIGPTLSALEEISLGLIRLVQGQPLPSVPVPLRITNVGTSPLEVALRSIDTELCVGDGCSKWAATLSPGDALDAPITVSPGEVGARAWTIHVESNEPGAERRTITVRAVVERFAPCQLTTPGDITIPLGMPARVDIRNDAATRCSIDLLSLTSTPDVMRIDGAPMVPLDFEPNQTRTFWLTTLQPRPRQAQGTLRIGSAGAPVIEIPVKLEVDAVACLAIAPDAFDFGTVKTGCHSATRTFTVSNACARPVPVTSPRLIGSGFELVTTFPDGELMPGATPLQFTARFAPTTAGSVSGAVVITSEGVDSIVALQARGDLGGPAVDTFFQPVLPVVDLLVMVDTSPSFAPRRANTRDNLRQVLTRVGRCADLRAAVAPADGAADAGVWFAPNDAGSAWTSNRDVDFFERVLGAFDALPVSSETEACVGPAAALMQGTTPRDGGVLGLCITDALEQSPNPATAFQTFSGGRAASWAAVAATSASTCAVESVDDGVHQALVQNSNGLFADVCNADWGNALFSGIGTVECGYRTSFLLTSTPAGAAAIEVRVNDQPVTTGWSYDASMNAVVFAPNAEPAGGSTVTITHTPVCTP